MCSHPAVTYAARTGNRKGEVKTMYGSTNTEGGSMNMRAEGQIARERDRYAAVKQYSLAQILAVWAAAAVPMAVLAWVVAPLLGALFGGETGFIKALLLCITAGLIWQFILTLILVRREQGTLRWERVRDALWLLSPRDRRSGRVGGRVWLWVIPFVLLFFIWEFFGYDITGPASHDFALFLQTRGQEFFSGNWVWFAVLVVELIFNTVLGEDLLFRGLLLPRMRGVFGTGDFVANGVLFAFYHLHQPWSIPAALADVILTSYPTRRWQSVWISIIVHSAQSVFVFFIVLALVLA
jgi:membrane protease YdiL (CAAX protease family)